MTEVSDIYEICLDRKSLCCIRQSGEDTCNKCRTYQMYKIGLEAGKPKWHDLRKNPEDLPKENGKYIIHIKVTERMSITDTCDFFNGYFGQYINPIAWCELPTFEEKE